MAVYRRFLSALKQPTRMQAALAPKSQEIQFANVPKHPLPLSPLTKFKGYIKKNDQTFDAIPIWPKLKITRLDVVTFQ